jgi:hypothetical protein
MAAADTKTRQRLVTDLLFHAMRVSDPATSEHAAEILSRTRPELARRLVREAARKANSPAYRLRVLAVVARRGRLSGPDDWLDLGLLAADKDPEIRAAAARCLVRHSPAAAPQGRVNSRSAGHTAQSRSPCPPGVTRIPRSASPLAGSEKRTHCVYVPARAL